MRTFSWILFLALAAAGCARYEFDLVTPTDLARHIGANADTVLSIDPLVYRLRVVENRLVMFIENPADDPIFFLGDQSFVVDPGRQSHPFRSEVIAPHSYIRRVLPPLPPPYYYYRPEPAFGFGLGFGVVSVHRFHHAYAPGAAAAVTEEPKYEIIYEAAEFPYWTWPPESQVRLSLTFRRADRTFHDEFTFRKTRVK